MEFERRRPVDPVHNLAAIAAADGRSMKRRFFFLLPRSVSALYIKIESSLPELVSSCLLRFFQVCLFRSLIRLFLARRDFSTGDELAYRMKFFFVLLCVEEMKEDT